MDEPQPVSDDLAPAPPAPAVPERDPFWGYTDLLVFVGLAIPSMLIGLLTGQAAVRLSGLPLAPKAAAIVGNFVGYGILFALLALLFRLQHDRPFWRSLGWVPSSVRMVWVTCAGIVTAFAVVVSALLLRTPNTPNPMTELMKDPGARILMAVVGTTLAPVCEELIFRGFLQPLLVRSLGAVGGILMTTLPFGLLHYREYGNSWRHALLISMAGAAFGWMRHASGSTKASSVMHAVYNGMFFAATLGKEMP